MPDERPTFVAFYTYEPSKNLDLERSEYKNDGFMLDGNEDMWPIAIRTKDITKDYTLPAFGVTYGMQTQSYFTDIDLDMGKHQNTEESLRVQYMLAGAHTETSTAKQYVTWGQDMFTLYSNTSYVASVNMMGCAWVQPMMYFCLTNIPMFRGSYLIQKVTHSIQPGDMKTTFNGVRMANIASRLSKDWIAKSYFDYNFGMGSTGGDAAYDNTVFASVLNDCQYKIFPLFGGDYSVAVGANEEAKMKTACRYFMEVMGYDALHAAAIAGNIWQESKWDEKAVNSDSGAQGLCQWIRRWQNPAWVKFYKQEFGRSPNGFRIIDESFEVQLHFIKSWLPGQATQYGVFKDEEFRRENTIEGATKYYMYKAEGPGGHELHTEKRIAHAKSYYEILTNGSTASSQPTQQDTSSSSAKKDDYVTALSEAIQKTVSHSKDLGQISVELDKAKSMITVKSSDNTTLASVFDMCLNGYHNYVSMLLWVANSSNQLAGVIIAVTANTQSTIVSYMIGESETTDWEHLDTNFYRALYKKYGNVGSDKQAFGRLQKEVKPFAGCSDSNAAGNLLGGSGVQPCPSSTPSQAVYENGSPNAPGEDVGTTETDYSVPYNANSDGPALCGDSWSTSKNSSNLSKHFKAAYPNGSIFAKGGMTAEAIKKQVIDAAKRNRPFILVFAGINGAGYKNNKEQFKGMIDAAKGSNIPIYICTIIGMSTKNSTTMGITNNLKNNVNPSVRALCNENSIARCVELEKYSASFPNSMFGSDGFHLTASGYEKLWGYIKPQIPN